MSDPVETFAVTCTTNVQAERVLRWTQQPGLNLVPGPIRPPERVTPLQVRFHLSNVRFNDGMLNFPGLIAQYARSEVLPPNEQNWITGDPITADGTGALVYPGVVLTGVGTARGAFVQKALEQAGTLNAVWPRLEYLSLSERDHLVRTHIIRGNCSNNFRAPSQFSNERPEFVVPSHERDLRTQIAQLQRAIEEQQRLLATRNQELANLNERSFSYAEKLDELVRENRWITEWVTQVAAQTIGCPPRLYARLRDWRMEDRGNFYLYRGPWVCVTPDAFPKATLHVTLLSARTGQNYGHVYQQSSYFCLGDSTEAFNSAFKEGNLDLAFSVLMGVIQQDVANVQDREPCERPRSLQEAIKPNDTASSEDNQVFDIPEYDDPESPGYCGCCDCEERRRRWNAWQGR